MIDVAAINAGIRALLYTRNSGSRDTPSSRTARFNTPDPSGSEMDGETFREEWDVATALQSHDVERLIPGEVDEKKGTSTAGRQQIVFLMGVEIELPGATGCIAK